jgi:hypothetical protein
MISVIVIRDTSTERYIVFIPGRGREGEVQSRTGHYCVLGSLVRSALRQSEVSVAVVVAAVVKSYVRN